MNHNALAIDLVVGLFALAPSASAQTFHGPTPYLSFDDSPFAGRAFDYFHLENFEDGLLNTLGVAAPAGFPHGLDRGVDSVDGDDGMIDGTCPDGWAYTTPMGLSR